MRIRGKLLKLRTVNYIPGSREPNRRGKYVDDVRYISKLPKGTQLEVKQNGVKPHSLYNILHYTAKKSGIKNLRFIQRKEKLFATVS